MNWVNLHRDQWISNETINHLIIETNQTCQRDRQRWRSSSTDLGFWQKQSSKTDCLSSGGAERHQCRWCVRKNIFHFLWQRSEAFHLSVSTFNISKLQNTSLSSSPSSIHWYFTRVIRKLWRPALTPRYNSLRSSSKLLTCGSSPLQIVAFETGNQFCRAVERAPLLHQGWFGAQFHCAGCWIQVKIRPGRK